MEETPGRASLVKLGCRTPPQLHAGGVGRQQQPYGRSILEYRSSYGFVSGEYSFLVFVPLGRGEDFEYVDCFTCYGCCQVYASVVGEFGAKCES